jgi:hypothetical protein
MRTASYRIQYLAVCLHTMLLHAIEPALPLLQDRRAVSAAARLCSVVAKEPRIMRVNVG